MGLTLLITGAERPLGRAVVATARERGHAVRALSCGEADLAAEDAVAALAEADCVIHLAGDLAPDRDDAPRDPLDATRRLVAALQAQPLPPRLVLQGSVAVYTADATGIVTEATPLEPRPARRDEHARLALAQEALLRESGIRHTILRCGSIAGAGRGLVAHLGLGIGGTLLLMERGGELPVVSLADCARALAMAAEMPGEGRALNILGADRPTRTRYVARMRGTGWPRHVLPFNWRLVMPLAWLLAPLGPRSPSLLRPAVLRARMRPLRYDIAAVKAALGWVPEEDFDTAFDQSV
ncbi:oxidoreductase [Roseovarius sp. A46]|nr:oxidoreductase [Roseovarius sp. A46]